MAEFIKVVPASSLQGSGLLLPPAFRDACIGEAGTYTLQARHRQRGNATGVQTTCNITRKMQGGSERADIHGGWRSFARDNGISANDEIRVRHLGGRVIEVVKTGRTGTPGRTPAKAPAAKTPAAKKTPARFSVSKKTPGSTGGVAKRRGSGSSAKKPAAAATPASPASGRRQRRSSQGTAAAAARAPEPAGADEQQGGGWCAIM